MLDTNNDILPMSQPLTTTSSTSGPLRRSRIRSRATFLREFIKSPGTVAAIAPSSPGLAAAMLRGLDLSTAHTVVEYGPGTGAFSRALLNRLGPSWFADPAARRFIAIEYTKPLADILQADHPEITVIHDSAANVESICASRGIQAGQVDAVISGLGWPSFTDELRTQILEGTAHVLKPGGEFRTFGYHVGLLMKGAWHFRREARRLFKEVHIGCVVWGNMPPAFVYRCVK